MVWWRLMAASVRRAGLWSLLLALGLSIALLWTLQPLEHGYAPNAGHDFILLYAAAHAIRDHHNPYDPATLLRYAHMSGMRIIYLVDRSHHMNQPYVYPPLFAWLVIPFTFLSPARALVAWRVVCALGVFAGTYGLTAPWRNEVGVLRTRTRRLLFAGLSVVAPVTIYGLYWGNPVELVYAAMGGWVWLLSRRGKWTDVAAGVLMSVSLLKPQLALPVAALSAGCFLWGADAMRRRWRVAKGFFGASVLLLLLDLLVTGPALLLAWPRSILYLARMTDTQSDMPSLLGLLKFFLQQLPVRVYTQITLLVVVVTVVATIALYWRLRGALTSTALFGLLTVLWCFGTPYGHANDEVLLIPGALALLAVINAVGLGWARRGAALFPRNRAQALRLASECLSVGLAATAVACLYAGGMLQFVHYHAHRFAFNVAMAMAPFALLVALAIVLPLPWLIARVTPTPTSTRAAMRPTPEIARREVVGAASRAP